MLSKIYHVNDKFHLQHIVFFIPNSINESTKHVVISLEGLKDIQSKLSLV